MKKGRTCSSRYVIYMWFIISHRLLYEFASCNEYVNQAWLSDSNNSGPIDARDDREWLRIRKKCNDLLQTIFEHWIICFFTIGIEWRKQIFYLHSYIYMQSTCMVLGSLSFRISSVEPSLTLRIQRRKRETFLFLVLTSEMLGFPAKKGNEKPLPLQKGLPRLIKVRPRGQRSFSSGLIKSAHVWNDCAGKIRMQYFWKWQTIPCHIGDIYGSLRADNLYFIRFVGLNWSATLNWKSYSLRKAAKHQQSFLHAKLWLNNGIRYQNVEKRESFQPQNKVVRV